MQSAGGRGTRRRNEYIHIVVYSGRGSREDVEEESHLNNSLPSTSSFRCVEIDDNWWMMMMSPASTIFSGSASKLLLLILIFASGRRSFGGEEGPFVVFRCVFEDHRQRTTNSMVAVANNSLSNYRWIRDGKRRLRERRERGK